MPEKQEVDGLKLMGYYLGSVAKGQSLAKEIGDKRTKKFENPISKPGFDKRIFLTQMDF